MTRIVVVLSLIVVLAVVKVNVFPASRTPKAASDNIIFIAAPKSGSESVAEALTQMLGYKQLKIASGYVPSDQIQASEIEFFFKQRRVLTKQHLDASTLNVQFIKRYTDRVVVHVRDPREILLSWVHHLNDLHNNGANAFLYNIAPMPPAGYFTWDLAAQIDWNIEHFLPALVDWMENWIALAASEAQQPNGLKILFTTYDEFVMAKPQLYNKILGFYAVELQQVCLLELAKTPKINFRKGDSNEWRSVYNETQLRKIAAIIPTQLLQRFGWQQV